MNPSFRPQLPNIDLSFFENEQKYHEYLKKLINGKPSDCKELTEDTLLSRKKNFAWKIIRSLAILNDSNYLHFVGLILNKKYNNIEQARTDLYKLGEFISGLLGDDACLDNPIYSNLLTACLEVERESTKVINCM